jgi:SEC-C motif-containing protein
MRSRYTAFALQDSRYLLDTWDPSTRPPAIELDPGIRWVRLVIVGGTGGGLLDSRGTVDFRADYRVGTQSRSLRENSLFLRQDKRWYYVGPS